MDLELHVWFSPSMFMKVLKELEEVETYADTVRQQLGLGLQPWSCEAAMLDHVFYTLNKRIGFLGRQHHLMADILLVTFHSLVHIMNRRNALKSHVKNSYILFKTTERP